MKPAATSLGPQRGQRHARNRQGETSCHCTVSELDKPRIAPGESAKITINWKASGYFGSFEQTASFSSNDPAQERFTLRITGQITAKVRSVPPELVFSQVSSDQPTAGEVRLYDYRDEPLVVQGHRFAAAETASHFEAVFQPLSAEELKSEPKAKSGYSIRVTVKPGMTRGEFKQKLLIEAKLSRRSEIEIPIKGVVADDISIAGPNWNGEQGVLVLGTANGREGMSLRVLLIVRGPYGKEVKFTAVESATAPLAVALGETKAIDNGQVTETPVTIEIPPGSRSVNYYGEKPADWGEIKIKTTHPQIPVLRIPVRFAVEE